MHKLIAFNPGHFHAALTLRYRHPVELRGTRSEIGVETSVVTVAKHRGSRQIHPACESQGAQRAFGRLTRPRFLEVARRGCGRVSTSGLRILSTSFRDKSPSFTTRS